MSSKQIIKNSTQRHHRRCTCGSKKKYRNCCGKTNAVRFEDLPQDTQKLIRETQIKYHIGEQYHTGHFGYTPEIVSVIFNNRRLVAIGGTLVMSDDPTNDWNFPSEFLSSHLKTTLGNDWFENEIKKPEKTQHIIIKWLLGAKIKTLDENKPHESSQLNGNALAYLHLAYDLFVLHNQNYLTSHLVNRLKIESSFNGARYEIFVLATMVRAGFNLEPFDETLGLGRVTECRATHIKTCETLQVEAKARNVKGVLGAKEGKQKNIDLYQKLRNAVEKDVHEPYIVFIDINLPEFDLYNETNKMRKIRNEYKKLEKNFSAQLPNIICFTNIPFHYARDDHQGNNITYGLVTSHHPRVPFQNEAQIIAALRSSLRKYKFLPKEFDESRNFADELAKNRKVKI